MSTHKGKPSGKFAEQKDAPGRKGDYKRSGWPEERRLQRAQLPSGAGRALDTPEGAETGGGRNRKAGSPV